MVSNVIREAIEKIVMGLSLSYQEAYSSMEEIMSGKATPTQIAAFLTALRIRGETVEEIIAFANAMRNFCCKISLKVRGRFIDICGTGGDKIKTFNISTTSAFVIAGAGVQVAKHGNRSFTSKCGSADVLENLGLNLNAPQENVKKAIEEVGIGFIFAPLFHPAMRHAASPRREIGIRTIFNILGPLANPAMPPTQVIGVCEASLVEKIAHVLKSLGLEEAMVMHGLDGLDEISTVGKTLISWLKEDKIKIFEATPADFGVKKASIEDVLGASPEDNAEILFKILFSCLKAGDPKRDIVAVNAAAGIIVGGKADDFKYGVELAQESIDSGAAYRKLKDLIKLYEGSRLEKIEELERKYG
jgi:anthranilate phosphoribosyltransferase